MGRPYNDPPPHDKLLTAVEVADMFRVDAKTVTRWAKDRRLDSIKTPGGQVRFQSSVIYKLLNDLENEAIYNGL